MAWIIFKHSKQFFLKYKNFDFNWYRRLNQWLIVVFKKKIIVKKCINDSMSYFEFGILLFEDTAEENPFGIRMNHFYLRDILHHWI